MLWWLLITPTAPGPRARPTGAQHRHHGRLAVQSLVLPGSSWGQGGPWNFPRHSLGDTPSQTHERT